MCECNPNIRTPFCGKPGCGTPKKVGNVFDLRDSARNPDKVLEKAIGTFNDVLLLGYDKDGLFEARASLNLQHKDILWIVDHFKQRLLNGDYAE